MGLGGIADQLVCSVGGFYFFQWDWMGLVGIGVAYEIGHFAMRLKLLWPNHDGIGMGFWRDWAGLVGRLVMHRGQSVRPNRAAC